MVLSVVKHGLRWSNPSLVSFLIVMACDAVFVAYFTLRPRAKPEGGRRARGSYVGMGLQAIGIALVGNVRRAVGTPIVAMPLVAQVGLGVLAAGLAVASLWLAMAAVLTLGKQWTYVAAVGEGHRLITEGAYGLVRHPIYAGMTGLVIATAIVISRWWVAPIAVALQLAGTWVRVREEERLLREAHGAAYAAYAARVPGIVPRM